MHSLEKAQEYQHQARQYNAQNVHYMTVQFDKQINTHQARD